MAKNKFYRQPAVAVTPNRWDCLSMLIVLSIFLAFLWAAQQAKLPFQLGTPVPISLEPSALPEYLLLTTVRMFAALFFALIFTLIVGTAAAKSERAGKIIVPLIDILQSVPILGYMAMTITAFISLFPDSMMGPECAVIFLVFTSQVWNMTLSFYQSLKTTPKVLIEASYIYQLSAWQRFWKLDVPHAIPGLIWNAMVSMSGGWFFIVAAESIPIANQSVMVPGIGSYIQMAIQTSNIRALAYAIFGMFIIIVLYDQLFFRPLIAWAEKYRYSESSSDEEASSSWFLNTLKRSYYAGQIKLLLQKLSYFLLNNALFRYKPPKAIRYHMMAESPPLWWHNLIWYSLLGLLIVIAGYYSWQFIYQTVPPSETWHLFILGFYTALRISILVLICSMIWVPVGVWIGLKPKVKKIVQPIAQFMAAFPANLFFPLFFIAITYFHLNPEIWTSPLLILGTQWYILFNVIAGASAIPKEILLAAQNMQLKGWLKWKRLYLPAIFPYFITGAITASGGAWNASIVAEYLVWGDQAMVATGLGSYITLMTNQGAFPQIALGIMVMCIWVLTINFLVWRPLYRIAAERCQMD